MMIGGQSSAPLRIGIVLTPKFTLSALANFIDVLRLAADEGDSSRPIRCQWHIMSPSGSGVVASCGVEVTPTSGLIDPKRLDYVAVIGGLLRRSPAVESAVCAYLVQAHDAGTPLIGICTGSIVLCRLGLMRGKRCCISWFHYQDFLREFEDMIPIADNLYVVDDDRITSSGGIGAAMLAANLVERHLGSAVAQKALHIMQIDKSRPGSMLQPAPPVASGCDDHLVTRALLIWSKALAPHSPSRRLQTICMSALARFKDCSRNISG
jgi:transcriptional regulator GlxA family with amidase domain